MCVDRWARQGKRHLQACAGCYCVCLNVLLRGGQREVRAQGGVVVQGKEVERPLHVSGLRAEPLRYLRGPDRTAWACRASAHAVQDQTSGTARPHKRAAQPQSRDTPAPRYAAAPAHGAQAGGCCEALRARLLRADGGQVGHARTHGRRPLAKVERVGKDGQLELQLALRRLLRARAGRLSRRAAPRARCAACQGRSCMPQRCVRQGSRCRSIGSRAMRTSPASAGSTTPPAAPQLPHLRMACARARCAAGRRKRAKSACGLARGPARRW